MTKTGKAPIALPASQNPLTTPTLNRPPKIPFLAVVLFHLFLDPYFPLFPTRFVLLSPVFVLFLHSFINAVIARFSRCSCYCLFSFYVFTFAALLGAS